MDDSYIAGFFDGEGNINRIKVKGRVYYQVRIYQKRPEVLEEIKKFLGYGNLFISKRGISEFTITKQNDIIDFLKRISPYSIVKLREVKKISA